MQPNEIDRWKNRRAMAWVSLCAIIGIGIAAVFNKLAAPQSDVIIAVVYSLAAVVGTYVGFATLDDKWKVDRDDRSN